MSIVRPLSITLAASVLLSACAHEKPAEPISLHTSEPADDRFDRSVPNIMRGAIRDINGVGTLECNAVTMDNGKLVWLARATYKSATGEMHITDARDSEDTVYYVAPDSIQPSLGEKLLHHTPAVIRTGISLMQGPLPVKEAESEFNAAAAPLRECDKKREAYLLSETPAKKSDRPAVKTTVSPDELAEQQSAVRTAIEHVKIVITGYGVDPAAPADRVDTAPKPDFLYFPGGIGSK